MAQSMKSVPSNMEYFEAMKTNLIKLLPHLTCFKCKSIPSAEFSNKKSFKCLNSYDSHLLCELCKGNCPCGHQINPNPCSLVSSLVNMLPFYCKNKENGCEEILFEEEMKAHVSRCIFELVTCINFDCEEEMPFKDFFDHIALPDCSFKPEINNRAELTLDDNDGNGMLWYPDQMLENPLNELLFYSFLMIEEDIIFTWIYFLGFKEDAERFTYSVKIDKNSKRSMNFRCPVKSIFESPLDIIKKREAFMIGLTIGKKLCNEQGILNLDFKIFDEKEEAKDDDNDSAISENTNDEAKDDEAKDDEAKYDQAEDDQA